MPPQGPPHPRGAGALFAWITHGRAKFYAVALKFTPGPPLFLQYLYIKACLLTQELKHIENHTRKNVQKTIDIHE